MKTIKDFKKDVNIMRNISDKTILTALVNYKFVGYFGKCVAHLNSKERNFVIDELIKRGYLNSDMSITKSAQTVILKNLIIIATILLNLNWDLQVKIFIQIRIE